MLKDPRPTSLTSALNWSSSPATRTVPQDACRHSSAAHTHASLALGLYKEHTAVFMAVRCDKGLLLPISRATRWEQDGGTSARQMSIRGFSVWPHLLGSWLAPEQTCLLKICAFQTISCTLIRHAVGKIKKKGKIRKEKKRYAVSVSSRNISSISISSIPWYERRLELRMRF